MKYFLKCSRRCLLAAPEQWMSVVIVLLKFTFILLSSLTLHGCYNLFLNIMGDNTSIQ